MNESPRIIQNQYQLLGPVGNGEGGMGVVYRAIDLTLDRIVAVKLIRPDLQDRDDIEKRFQREAKALARLNHPNIASVYNFCRDGNEYCLVMEFINGHTLTELLKLKGPFSQSQAIDLIVQALNGLAHAHERGVLHRDIKPANLMLTSEGTLKLLDFGIARLTDAPTTQITQTKYLTGTVRYMAPELLDGGQPSTSSDLYALNLVLYELLTGRAAFKAPTVMRLIIQILNEPLPSLQEHLPQASGALTRLMERMMAKDPAVRISDARQLAKALGEAAATPAEKKEELTAEPPTSITLVDPLPRVRLSTPASSPSPERPNTPAPDPASTLGEPAWALPKKRGKGLWIWLLLVSIVLGGTGIWYILTKPVAMESVSRRPQPSVDSTITESVDALPTTNPTSKDTSSVAQQTELVSNKPDKPTVGQSTVNRPNQRPEQKQPVTQVSTTQASRKPQLVVESSTGPVNPPATVPISSQTRTDVSVPVVKKNDENTTSELTDKPVERPVARPVAEPKSVTITRKTTLRLTPLETYRADRLNRGDEVRFTVSAVIGEEVVSLGSQAAARAVVSEVQAVGGLTTRSYIFLKRMVLEFVGNEPIKLSLMGSEPEIRFDAKQANAVIGTLQMRAAKPLTVNL
ncbi:serine/threonine protein kinase [Fibrisoma montanum]|uniref:Serine/threonine protein kinase n=1 Tax=Fibrisoma montanum TaxID=2305895 RepID=A0A418M704_9BACT|nr:serine/threonine-protein kinase [Fibrisoma montanum]RIV21586.1 serine/threonine protein kinase [Fibrisoma montanum]